LLGKPASSLAEMRGSEDGIYKPPSGARPLSSASLKVTSGDFRFVE